MPIMFNEFGDIILSEETLSRSGLGLWAVELEEGKDVRLFFDASSRALFGIEEGLSPEMTYLIWNERVAADCHDILKDAFHKMADDVHAEARYTYRLPDGREILVRTGGIRNAEFSDFVRVEGFNQNITGTIRFNKEIIKQRQRLRIDYQTISGLASGYDTLHLINLKDDEFLPYYIENTSHGDDTGHMMANYPDFWSAQRDFVERYCHPDHRERLARYADKDFVCECLRDKKRSLERVLVKYPDGSYRWNDFVFIKLDDAREPLTRFAAASVDVDDQVKEEQESMRLLEQARLAEQAGKERYNFLVNVAHELRTPLTLIIGPLKRVLRLDSAIEGKSRLSIERVCRQADRMTNLLNTVLTTNKIEEGADAARPEPVDYNEWVTSSTDEFRDEAEDHEMALLVDTDRSIGSVDIDEHLCKIVFSNLMINAIRHNDPGSPIEVSTRWSDDCKFVRLSVKDHGSGIGDVDVSKLFERYWRATEEKTGFGIGLSYSKTIVDAHHGRIGAYNNENDKGATFWFELPADFSKRVVTSGEAAVPDSVHVEPKSLKDKVILYVEDDKDLRDYVNYEMFDLCREFLTAYNGRKALEILESRKDVDIVIADVMMPEVDGLELCRRLKSDPGFRRVPVILLSARADSESIRKGYDAMADYYLDKPFDIDKLLDILNNKIK